jgi:Lanthionine synthetase C-like protein
VRAALERQRTERSLDTPMLCHGTAGLGQVTLHMAADTGAEDLSREARRLCLELVDQVDPDAPFGYRSEARLRELWGFEVDPTLLNGAPGPALVLLTAATDTELGSRRPPRRGLRAIASERVTTAGDRGESSPGTWCRS